MNYSQSVMLTPGLYELQPHQSRESISIQRYDQIIIALASRPKGVSKPALAIYGQKGLLGWLCDEIH